MLILRTEVFMFPREVIESFIYIALITAAFVWYGVAAGRSDRDTESSAEIFKKTA